MNVVTLTDFVSEFSCYTDSDMNNKASSKFLKPENLIDEIENDTDLFDLYGILYVYRSYLCLFNGSRVQKVLERCLEFIKDNPHSNPQYMFKCLMRKNKDSESKKVITNVYRNDESVRNVNLNTVISFINDIVNSKIIEDHFDNYNELVKLIDNVSSKYFSGYRLEMILLEDILIASQNRTTLLNGVSISNPHWESLNKSDSETYLELKSVSNKVEKEALFHNLVVEKRTKQALEIMSSNLYIAFNVKEFENYRNSLTRNLIFINMSDNTTCFTSWEDLKNWVTNNSEIITDIISVIEDVKSGGSSAMPKETTIAYDFFTVLKRPMFDHVKALSVGSSNDEVEQNKNRQKLYSGLQNILERQLGNK